MWDEADGRSNPDGGLSRATGERLDELRLILEDVSDQLGDVSMELIRDAIEHGSGRPTADRTVAKVRRAVDKAASLLDGLASSAEAEDQMG